MFRRPSSLAFAAMGVAIVPAKNNAATAAATNFVFLCMVLLHSMLHRGHGRGMVP